MRPESGLRETQTPIRAAQPEPNPQQAPSKSQINPATLGVPKPVT
jgi:hypothetical protein